MSCALTQGFSIDCREGMGGLKELYVIELNNVSGITAASGVITTIAKQTGKRFWKYQQLAQTAQATEEITGSDENGTIYYAQSIEIFLNKMQASLRNEVSFLAKNRCIIVTVDRNGKAFLYGQTLGLTVNTGTGGSGRAYGDRNGYGLTFAGAEPEPAQEVQASVIATLETPG